MIKNGQEANETNFNTAFVSRTSDTSTTGKLALQNTSDATSGGTIANAQRAITETFDAVGIVSEGDATRKQYSSNNYVTNGDSHKAAIGKLDAQAKAQSTAAPNVSNATGTLPLANGGTGQTTKASAYDALSPNTTEGDLEVRGTTNTGRLGVGTSGQVLTVDTTVTGKVKWAALPAQSPPNVSTATGTLPIANGGTNATTSTAAFQNLSPLTTKADLLVNNQRLPVGSDAQVLTADSTTSAGVKWATVSSANPNVSNATGTLAIANGGTGQATKTAAFNALSPTTTAGDLIYSDGTNNTRLGVGTSGQYLTVSGNTPTWATVNPGAVATYWIASYYYNANTAVAANTPIKWDTKREDTNNSFNTATGVLTVPFTGRMRVFTSNQITSGNSNVYLRKTSGTAVNTDFLCNVSLTVLSGHTILPVTAGDTFVVQMDSAATFVGMSTAYGATSKITFERAAY